MTTVWKPEYIICRNEKGEWKTFKLVGDVRIESTNVLPATISTHSLAGQGGQIERYGANHDK